ncbi:MAG: CHASE2 domain-containing protein [Rubrivivax sp.]
MPREALAGKLVLVGLTGAGLNDMRTTVLGELVPGIEIQAQLIESLFEGRLLRRPSWMRWAETGAALVLGLLVIWFIPRRDVAAASFLRRLPKVTVLLTLGTNGLVIGLGYAVFHFTGWLFDAASFSQHGGAHVVQARARQAHQHQLAGQRFAGHLA